MEDTVAHQTRRQRRRRLMRQRNNDTKTVQSRLELQNTQSIRVQNREITATVTYQSPTLRWGVQKLRWCETRTPVGLAGASSVKEGEGKEGGGVIEMEERLPRLKIERGKVRLITLQKG
ncbi:hypothetical protein V6N12_019379 [Hibiscus sabdariffa]|uniref:Uncharacterized protein n=1 Tax=Hibiscus sabdariffa TaxID=183260 RepID=A0ABR2BM40_9ROSI